ncbi:hypothetical protein AB0D49_24625 [Streptomyces sp. NPDC048290]|uniref:hypothetical protein n=1 Tax=Streptomyces sp. NPDC048290 TaxID=3155811 RepID=UPI00342A3E98
MSDSDLMGGYAAYTTSNAAVQELAATGAVAEAQFTPTVIASLVSGITITIAIFTQ